MASGRFITNIFLLIFLNLLIKPAWVFLIDRNVQLQVGHDAYGLYNALFSLSIIFSILLDLGITNFNNKRIASDAELLDSTLPNLLLVKLLLAPLFTLTLLGVGYLLNYTSYALYLLLLLALTQILSSLLLFLRSNVSGHHDFKIDSFLSVLDKLLMMVLCAYFLFGPTGEEFSIAWFLYIQIFSTALACAIAWLIIQLRYKRFDPSRIHKSEMLALIKSSLPYAVLILLMSIYIRSTPLLLERLAGAKENGLFAEAFRILDMLNMVGYLFAGMLLPMFARMLANQDNFSSLLRNSTNILMSISLAATAWAVIYARETMQLLYQDDSESLTTLYRIILFSFPAMSLMNIYSTLLTAAGALNNLIRIAAWGSALSLLGGFFLIFFLQSTGAAISFCAIQWILGIWYILATQKKLSLKTNFPWLFRFTTFFLVFAFSNFFMHFIGITLLASLLLNVPLYMVSLLATRLVNRHEIRGLIKQLSPGNTV